MNLSEQIKAGFEKVESLFKGTPEMQATVTRLTAELEKSKTDLTAANGKLAQAETDLATAKQTIGTLTAERDAHKQRADTAEATLKDPKGEIAQRASAQAANIVAATGQPAIASAPTAAPNGTAEKTVTRAGFIAMHPKGQMEFIKSGGKVSE